MYRITLLWTLIFGHLVNCSAQDLKPNVVIINIDDLGWKDVSYNSNNSYETPIIDSLVANGMVFTNAYAAASNCAPSRASLLTGQWTQRHGIFTVGSSERGKSEDRKLIPIKNTTNLDSRYYTLGNLFSDSGYTTIHAGKWHISSSPSDFGFQINIGGSHAGHPSSYYPPYKNVSIEAAEGERLTDKIMDVLLNEVQNSTQPFFINYAPYAVHTPIEPVPELLDKYKKKKLGSDINVNYATMVENMDTNVGRLINKLVDLNLLKDTIIIFTSDNGGLFFVSNQHPLRSGKGSYYEGGIRIPMAIVWPGHIQKKLSSNVAVSQLDIYPTLIDLCGLEQGKTSLDGVSLKTLLIGHKYLQDCPLFWHFPIYLEAAKGDTENRDSLFRTRPGSAIRLGNWKLQHYFENNEVELFDLSKDISETNDLSRHNIKMRDSLVTMLANWRERTNAPIPTTLNPDFNENN